MMVNGLWITQNENQIRIGTDAAMYAEGQLQAAQAISEFPGWMFWKKYPNGREYLVHAFDRSGRGTTLGSRSSDNERFFEAFKSQQADAKLRLSLATERVKQQARFIRAARLNRFPRPKAQVARIFGEPRNNGAYLIIGTHAMYGYEAIADVLFLPTTMETKGLDILWDSRKETKLAANSERTTSMSSHLALLKVADKSYLVNAHRKSQATNEDGCCVDFLCAERESEQVNELQNEEISPCELTDLGWLLLQRIRTVLFDQDGMPLTIVVPDPRLFAAHKLWLSGQNSRRDEQRDHDKNQANCLAALISSRRPVLVPLERAALEAHAEIFECFLKLFPHNREFEEF